MTNRSEVTDLSSRCEVSHCSERARVASSMATASEVGGLVQVVLKPLGGSVEGGDVELGPASRRLHRQVLEREFAAVADSWIATVS